MCVFERKEGISEGAEESLGCEIDRGASFDAEKEEAFRFWLKAGQGEYLGGKDVAGVGIVPFKYTDAAGCET